MPHDIFQLTTTNFPSEYKWAVLTHLPRPVEVVASPRMARVIVRIAKVSKSLSECNTRALQYFTAKHRVCRPYPNSNLNCQSTTFAQ